MKDPHEILERAIRIVREGGIIIFPTDTAFGIGCRIDNHKAVDRLFAIRKRPLTQAMPVLVSGIDMALTYFNKPTDIVRRLMVQYWPGALTIVASCQKELIYSPIRGGGSNIGLRMPNHPVVLEIIKRVGVPILGPSANFHKDTTPYSEGELNKKLIALADYVVPGECLIKRASTVVDCSIEPYTIVRQGSVVLV